MTNYGCVNMLTSERLKELLEYCPNSGEFTWKNSRGSVKAGAIAGSKNSLGYIQIQVDGVNQFGHRLAWLYQNGSFPIGSIDHINGDVWDNRICNLRDVNHKTNLQNRRKAPCNNYSSGLLGVSRSGNRWRAYITVDGRQMHLGCFSKADDAHDAHVKAKRKLHAGCTI